MSVKACSLYIEGRIRTRSWDDQNGNKRYTTEIWADNMQMLSYKQEGDNGGNTPRPYNAPATRQQVRSLSSDDP